LASSPGTLPHRRSDDIGNRSATDPERVAGDYASDLLLPRYLLEPMLRALRRPTLKAVRETAEAFDASLTATALKIAETDFFPIMLVSHTQQGRGWFRKAPSVPEHWFPKQELDHESYAFSVLFGKHENEGGPRRIGADAWFDRREAEDFEIYEETLRVACPATPREAHLAIPSIGWINCDNVAPIANSVALLPALSTRERRSAHAVALLTWHYLASTMKGWNISISLLAGRRVHRKRLLPLCGP